MGHERILTSKELMALSKELMSKELMTQVMKIQSVNPPLFIEHLFNSVLDKACS